MQPATHNPKSQTALPLLADPASYIAATSDLLADAAGRETWLGIFDRHTEGLVKLAAESHGETPEAKLRAAAFGAEFGVALSDYRRDPVAHGVPSVIRFCQLRQAFLQKQGFDDPYLPIKQRENEAALKMLPGLLAELDAMPDAARVRSLIENIFAGNIFDLGCAGTIALYESGQADFHAVRAKLPARPWCVDDFDLLAARLAGKKHDKAVVFVDNAGADVVLGMVPFVRELLCRGTRVVLTANTLPALNDITHAELVPLMERIAAFDAVCREAVARGRLEMIASGNDIPLIDLSRVSPELAAAARDADLLVLEGMGRSLESNYRAKFTVDTLKVAMVKERFVAEAVGTRMYGVVCRFEESRGNAGEARGKPRR